VTKIIPAPDARTKSIETRIRTRSGSRSDRLVTQLIPLRYADPNEIKRLFTPLVSKSSVIVAYAPTNMLIITDAYSNIQRLMRIVQEVDVEGIGQEISVIPLFHADSKKLVSILTSVFQTRQAGKKAPAAADRAKFVADERTNAIVILASEVDTIRIKRLVELLDRETPRGSEKIRVYYLENANAEELAKVLQEIPTKGSTPEKGKPAPALSEDIRITADKATNSLIIQAESGEYQIIEEIIQKLDIPRAMVYIEALIMEVDAEREFQFGTEWTAVGATNIGDRDAAFGGGFNRGLEESSLPGLTQGILPGGFSMGVFTEAIEIAGVSFSNLTALINALRSDQEVNILSTPQLLTTENEEAKINVGKNIPFQTRTSTTDNETFNSFEYRDVGTILKVTPQINQERSVRLNISLELQVLESTVDFRPTTLKRTIDTTVVVKDANTIVIGGLIDENTAERVKKVPLLGDIPVLGWLFKYKSTASQKQNLFIFLTPHVVKDPSEAVRIYDDKRERIESLREGDVKLYGPKEPDRSGVTFEVPGAAPEPEPDRPGVTFEVPEAAPEPEPDQ
jgi:general secretion pathway protein D